MRNQPNSEIENTILSYYAVIPKFFESDEKAKDSKSVSASGGERSSAELNTLFNFYLNKARNLTILQRSSPLIYQEAFGSPEPEKPAERHLIGLIKDMIDEEEKLDEERKKKMLNANPSRASELNDGQLDIFLEFKEQMLSEADEEIAKYLTDNDFCKFLMGFAWNYDLAVEKMRSMLVSS